MNKPPTIRLHLYLASAADRGVILRQGPSKHFCMIGWDTTTDTFEVGQWVKQKIYTERCDISPDGQYFLYFILNGRWQSRAKGTHTVISRVPYFSALALYPQGNTWGGGGFFVDDTSYYVATYDNTPDIVEKAVGLRRIFGPRPPSFLGDLFRALRRFFDGTELSPVSERARPIIEEVEASVARRNRYVTEGAKLYRRTADDGQTLIGDFSDMEYAPIMATYDAGVKE